MNWIEYIKISIIRNFFRIILSVLSFTIIFIFLFITIFMLNSIGNVNKSIMQNFSSTVFIKHNFPLYQNFADNYRIRNENRLTKEMIYNIGRLEFVEKFDYFSIVYLWCDQLDVVVTNNQNNIPNKIAIYGSNYQFEQLLENNIIRLHEGELFNKYMKNFQAIIPLDIALKNNLKVGDNLDLRNVVYDYLKLFNRDNPNAHMRELNEEYLLLNEIVSFKVVGIFDYNYLSMSKNEDQLKRDTWNAISLLNSSIFVPYNVTSEILNSRYQIISYQFEKYIDSNLSNGFELLPNIPYFNLQARFTLNSPRDFDNFKEIAREFLNDYLTLESNNNLSKHLENEINFLENLTSGFVLGIISSMILIYFIIEYKLLSLKKKEILTLLSLGKIKSKIFLLCFIENFIIFIMGFLISLPISWLLTNRIARKFLAEMLNPKMIINRNWNDRIFEIINMNVNESITYFQLNPVNFSFEIFIIIIIIFKILILSNLILYSSFFSRIKKNFKSGLSMY